MAFVAGTFTALNDIKYEMGQIFRQNQIDSHLLRGTPVFDALAQGQSFELAGEAMALIDGRQCNTLIAHWITGAKATILDDTDLADDATDCVIGGAQLGSDSKNYVPNVKFHVEGQVADTNCKNVEDKAQKDAKLMMNLLATMDHELELRMHASLLANEMTLVTGDIAGKGQLQETGTIWDIDGADWIPELVADFKVLADRKQFFDPKIISGANLYKEQFLALYKDGDTTDYSTLLGANRPIPLVNNLLDLDTSTGRSSTFIVDNANIAYFNTHKWDTTVVNQNDQYNTQTFAVRSNRLSWRNGNALVPVMYDVKRQRSCVGSDEWVDSYRIQHNGGIVFGPQQFAADQSGVIHVVKDYVA